MQAASYPLGSTHEQGGHKGYALSAMVDILCVLSGANWGPCSAIRIIRRDTKKVSEKVSAISSAQWRSTV
jgi:LDH2 family malate/lactate/ureidoglycolate dehydrogenase